MGQAPQKRSLAGAASCLLHNMVALLAEKACQMGSKYTCQIWRKKWQKTAIKHVKLTVNHRNRTRQLAFLMFWPELVILRGYNMM